MEYLVHTSGEVSKFHNKAYVVKASTEQEAQEIAKKKFEKEFDCVKIHAEAQSYTRTKRAIAACILMLVAIVISLFTYKYSAKILLFIPTKREFSILPGVESTIFAIVFYSIYVIRFKGIERAVGSFFDTTFTILSVLLLSSVFQLILTTDNLRFLGFIPLPEPYAVLTIAILASLFGVKLISVACIIFIAIVAVSNIDIADDAMGIWGTVYIMCSFIGILLYLSVEPAILEALPQIKGSFANTFKGVKKDFTEARGEAESIINKLPK